MQLSGDSRAGAGAGSGTSPPEGGERIVDCPSCRRPTRFAPDNPFRPFCSARCRGLDLGAWSAEDYRVAAPPPTEGGRAPSD